MTDLQKRRLNSYLYQQIRNPILINYVPFVPTCLTYLGALNYCVLTCPHFSHVYVQCAYVSKYIFVLTCLLALNYFVPTCAQGT